jgi:hypothetical protein
MLPLNDQRECMAWALLAWLQPLRMAQTRRIVRRRGVAPSVPVVLDIPKQLSDRPTPRVPLLEDVPFPSHQKCARARMLWRGLISGSRNGANPLNGSVANLLLREFSWL